MLDAHAHLHDKQFDADRDEVVHRARVARVERIITIGTDLRESQKALECAEKYDGVYAAVGIHPHEYLGSAIFLEGRESEWLADLEQLAGHPKVVAIGECGLDYFSRTTERSISDEEKSRQKTVFRKQIELAQKLGLPLIIHCREAYRDLAEILRSIPDRPVSVIHCHEGDVAETKELLELGCFFSFTGNVTYKKRSGSDRDEMLDLVPLDRMLVETDCPYLAPVPHRGKRNEPAYVVETARYLAQIKGVSESEFEKKIEENAIGLFKKLKV